jgi:hypothetical protein
MADALSMKQAKNLTGLILSLSKDEAARSDA